MQPIIQRKRIEAWFETTSASAVRIVSATVGTGKTSALKQYVTRSGGRAAYVRVPAGAGGAELRELLDSFADAPELILDDADRIAPAAYERLVDDVADGAVRQRLTLVGRSRRRLLAHVLVPRGLAATLDAGALAFDAAELAALAAAYGVPCDENDVAQLMHDTEGWPVAAQWLVRDAAERGHPLRIAFSAWRAHNGHLLVEYVEHERHPDDAASFEGFRALLAEGAKREAHELERLEQLGLPLVRTRAGVRPYRILTRLAAPETETAAHRISRGIAPPMLMNVLGTFRCEIAGRPVSFVRRRDRNVLVYVALAPESRATREQLMDAFWPGGDRRIAAQGLRTTLSRIRRAISEAAPGVDPERYVSTAGQLRVNVSAVAVDAHRFVENLEQGRLDDALGSPQVAKQHYRRAHHAYGDRLFASEALEPCFITLADHYHRLYFEALSRLTQLHAALGELEAARDYARELMACNSDDVRSDTMNVFSALAQETA